MDHKPVMGYFSNSSCPDNSFDFWYSLRGYCLNDSYKAALVLAQKRLLDFHLDVKQIRYRILRMLTACLYSDNVFKPNTGVFHFVPYVFTA